MPTLNVWEAAAARNSVCVMITWTDLSPKLVVKREVVVAEVCAFIPFLFVFFFFFFFSLAPFMAENELKANEILNKRLVHTVMKHSFVYQFACSEIAYLIRDMKVMAL